MFSMFKQMFMMFSTFFSAGERLARSLDNLATIGEEMSQSYLNESRVRNAIALTKLQQQQAAALPSPQQP
jgi:hypothetical protein